MYLQQNRMGSVSSRRPALSRARGSMRGARRARGSPTRERTRRTNHSPTSALPGGGMLGIVPANISS